MSNHALTLLSTALRRSRNQLGTRWRKLTVGKQALLVVAHLRKGETYTDLAAGFGIGTTTAFRCIREAVDALAAHALTLDQAIEIASEGVRDPGRTLLRIDRVAMSWGRDRLYYSGKHKCHGVNMQVIADPAGGLIWASPGLPGARHDMRAAREHGLIDTERWQLCCQVVSQGDPAELAVDQVARKRLAEPRWPLKRFQAAITAGFRAAMVVEAINQARVERDAARAHLAQSPVLEAAVQ